MRPEKQYLLEEIGQHLEKSRYVYLAGYEGINAEETSQLRQALARHQAEFHVVKNSLLALAAKERGYPELGTWLKGQTAIIVGGDQAPEVAKSLADFFKNTQKAEIKGGVLEEKILPPEDIKRLAQLPPFEVLRAQLLGLLNTPAQRLLGVLQGVPRGLLTVLQAQSEKQN